MNYLFNFHGRAFQDIGTKKINRFSPIKIKRFFCLALFMIVNLFFLSGCASLNDRQQTIGEGTVTGGLIGGVVGGIAGLIAGGGKGAIIGAISGVVAGGVAGGFYGNHVADKKQSFVNNEAYMRAVLAESDKVLVNSKAKRETLKLDVASRKKKVDVLKKQKTSKSKSNTSLARLAKNNSQDIEKTNQLILNVENEIEVQKTVLAREKHSLSPQLVSLSESKTSDLEAEHRRLKLLKAQLANLDIRRMY